MENPTARRRIWVRPITSTRAASTREANYALPAGGNPVRPFSALAPRGLGNVQTLASGHIGPDFLAVAQQIALAPSREAIEVNHTAARPHAAVRKTEKADSRRQSRRREEEYQLALAQEPGGLSAVPSDSANASGFGSGIGTSSSRGGRASDLGSVSRCSSNPVCDWPSPRSLACLDPRNTVRGGPRHGSLSSAAPSRRPETCQSEYDAAVARCVLPSSGPVGRGNWSPTTSSGKRLERNAAREAAQESSREESRWKSQTRDFDVWDPPPGARSRARERPPATRSLALGTTQESLGRDRARCGVDTGNQRRRGEQVPRKVTWEIALEMRQGRSPKGARTGRGADTRIQPRVQRAIENRGAFLPQHRTLAGDSKTGSRGRDLELHSNGCGSQLALLFKCGGTDAFDTIIRRVNTSNGIIEYSLDTLSRREQARQGAREPKQQRGQEVEESRPVPRKRGRPRKNDVQGQESEVSETHPVKRQRRPRKTPEQISPPSPRSSAQWVVRHQPATLPHGGALPLSTAIATPPCLGARHQDEGEHHLPAMILPQIDSAAQVLI